MRIPSWTILGLMCAGMLDCKSTGDLATQPSKEKQSNNLQRDEFTKLDVQALPGALRERFRVEGSGKRIWFYRATSNQSNATVLIPATTSNGISGATLGDVDEAFALQFVAEGINVIMYDVGLATPKDADTLDAFTTPIRSMIHDGGLTDGRAAIDFAHREALAKRIVVLGIDSSASLALRLAASESSLAGCVLISPPSTIGEGSTGVVIDTLKPQLPELLEFLETNDFEPLAARVTVPTMIFVNEHQVRAIGGPSRSATAQQLVKIMKVRNPDALLLGVFANTRDEALLVQGYQLISNWVKTQSGLNDQ